MEERGARVRFLAFDESLRRSPCISGTGYTLETPHPFADCSAEPTRCHSADKPSARRVQAQLQWATEPARCGLVEG